MLARTVWNTEPDLMYIMQTYIVKAEFIAPINIMHCIEEGTVLDNEIDGNVYNICLIHIIACGNVIYALLAFT